MKISKEDRIYGLSLIWRDAKYNFARWDEKPNLNWDAAYREYLPLVSAEEDAFSYYELLQQFISLLGDGHTYVTMPDSISSYHEMPFNTTHSWGKHIVNAVPKGCETELYSEITAINGTPLEVFLKTKVYPYIWHEKENSAFHWGKLWYYIGLHEGNEIEITTKNGAFTFTKGDSETREIPCEHPEFKNAELIFHSDCCSMRRTKDNIALINFWTCSDNSIKQTLYQNIDEYRNCKGFLIDLRENNGGDSQNAAPLIQLFFNGEFPDPPSETPLYPASYGAHAMYMELDRLDMNNPWENKVYKVGKHKLFDLEKDYQHIKDCPAFLTQPVVLLTSCATCSAAEDMVSAMKYQNRSLIVGESTFGSNGQPFRNQLPGGGYYGICTHKCYTHEGFDYNNIGILPDVFAENSRDDMLRGYDRVFDVGLNKLREML